MAEPCACEQCRDDLGQFTATRRTVARWALFVRRRCRLLLSERAQELMVACAQRCFLNIKLAELVATRQGTEGLRARAAGLLMAQGEVAADAALAQLEAKVMFHNSSSGFQPLSPNDSPHAREMERLRTATTTEGVTHAEEASSCRATAGSTRTSMTVNAAELVPQSRLAHWRRLCIARGVAA